MFGTKNLNVFKNFNPKVELNRDITNILKNLIKKDSSRY